MFCEWLQNEFQKIALKANPWTVPSSMEVALWIGNPTADLSGGAEVSGNNYARVPMGSGDWLHLPYLPVSNFSVIDFPEATGLWGEVTHVVLYGMVTGALHGFYYGALAESKDIDEGAQPKFQIDDLTVTLT